MSVATLPVELLHRISAFCDKREIRQLRLTSQRLSAVADHYLLPTLELYYALESLQVAIEISRRPRIAKSVRFICFHADRFNGQRPHTISGNDVEMRCGILSSEDWLKHQGWHQNSSPLRIAHYERERFPNGRCRQALERVSRMNQVVHNTVRADNIAYAYYLRLMYEQGCLDKDNRIELAFRALFEACPNVEDVLVTAGDSLAPTTTPRLRCFRKAGTIPWSDPDSRRSGVHALSSVMRAAACTDKKLRGLLAGRLSHEFFWQDAETWAQLTKCFMSVEKFIIELESPFQHRQRDDDEVQAMHFLAENQGQRISSLLAVASNLQELTLLPFGRSGNGRVNLATMIGSTYWPFLCRVRLDRFNTTQLFLVEFLLRHEATLESLYLADIRLTEGDWHRGFRAFAGRLSALRDVRLRGAFCSNDGEGEDGERRDYYLVGYPWKNASYRMTLQLQQYLVSGLGDLPVQREKVDFASDNETITDEIEPYLKHWIR